MYKDIFNKTFATGKHVRIIGGPMVGYHGTIKSANYNYGNITMMDNSVINISTTNMYIH